MGTSYTLNRRSRFRLRHKLSASTGRRRGGWTSEGESSELPPWIAAHQAIPDAIFMGIPDGGGAPARLRFSPVDTKGATRAPPAGRDARDVVGSEEQRDSNGAARR